MGFNPPVPQKYTDWEIRAAVLISLGIQICLIFIAPLRRRSASRLPRFLVWSLYLLADWIADLALGLLLNNMGNIGSSNSNASLTVSTIGSRASGGKSVTRASDSSSSPIIFAFWAPFLLLHLGGPDTITAYSIEDAELWLRHLIGLLFELFAAAVVFFCSLSSNPFIPATVLMFVVGTAKYGERTYSLYHGSVDGFRNSVLGKPVPGPNYAKLMEEFEAKKDSGLPAEIEILKDAGEKKLEPIKKGSLQYIAYQFYQNFRRLFVDLILSFEERKISRQFFLESNTDQAFAVVEMELGYIYDVTYTKSAVIHTPCGYVARCIGSVFIISAFLFFVFLNKQHFKKVDIAITYLLLIGAIILDAVALLMLLFSDWTRVFLEKSKRCEWLTNLQWCQDLQTRRKRWGNTISQFNLIRYCLDKPVQPDKRILHRIFYYVLRAEFLFKCLRKVAETFCFTEMLDETIYMTRKPVNCEIKDFIFKRLIKKSEEARDLTKIKEVCNQRGLAAFEAIIPPLDFKKEDKIREEVRKYQTINDEVQKNQNCEKIIRNKVSPTIDFDHSLLLWHIATELCYSKCSTDQENENADTTIKVTTYCSTDQENENADTTIKVTTLEDWKRMGKLLSDYMLYLLVKQPAMLMTTSGIGLIRFRDTCAEARRFFNQAWWDLDQEKACEMLLSVNTSTDPADVKGDRSKSVLFEACILAKCLFELKEEKKMWQLIAEVWAEMLFYAASHCRGYGHVRQLSKGGEMLTIVWLLMAHLGLGEMYQIQGGDAKAKLIVEM